MPVYANQYVDEGTSNSTSTVTFPWKAKRFVLMNDGSIDLQFKINSSETYATLHTGETVTMEHTSVRAVYLNSAANCAYRLWAHG